VPHLPNWTSFDDPRGAWHDLGMDFEEFEALLRYVDLPEDYAHTLPPHLLLEHIAATKDLPTRLRNLPAVRHARSAAADRRKEEEARVRAHAREKRNAQARAQRAGVRCWPALRNKPVNAEHVRLFEGLLQREGWLSHDWTPERGSSDAAWPLQFPAVAGSSVGSRTVRVEWVEVQPLVAALLRNEAALSLAVALRWQHSLPIVVNASLSASVARRIHATVDKLTSVAVPAAEAAWSTLSLVQWRMLSRVAEPLRWSLISGRTSPGQRRAPNADEIRSLNWEQYQRAKVSPGARFAALPPTLQWARLTGLPRPPGALPALEGLKVATLHKLLAVADLKFHPQAVTAGDMTPILNLTRLFGDEAAVKRFVLARGLAWDRKGLHDAGQFVLPRSGWTPAQWAPVCLRHPQAVRYAREFAKLEQAGEVPQSWSQLQAAALRITYPALQPGFEPLLEFCLKNKLSASAFEEAQTFWATATVKPAEFMPHLKITGDELGLSGDWVFSRLTSDDIRGPLLGHLTGCCQHLSGAGAPCARHGVTSPYSAFYVLTFKGQVFAQSWAWRSLQGGLVWDSIESRPAADAELDIVSAFYREASARLLKGPLQVTAVYLGDTTAGISEQVARRLLPLAKQRTRHGQRFADHCDYADAHTQFLLAGSWDKKAVAWREVQGCVRTAGKAPVVEETFPYGALDAFYRADPDTELELDEQGGLYAWTRGHRFEVRPRPALDAA